MPCKDLKNLEMKDGFIQSLGTDIEMLTFTATVDGTCNGQKIMPQHGMSIYTKQDGAWKLVFGFSAAS